MGYKRRPKQYRLKFEGEEYEGLTVLMTSLSVDEFIGVTELANKLISNEQDAGDVGRLFDVMAEKIIEWNLEEDDGRPVPHTPEQLRKEDFDFIMAIQMSWMGAMASVPGPLPNGSSSGATSPEDMTTELEKLSRSLPS